MSLELEWYENVRNGNSALCDRCNNNIDIDDFFNKRNQRGVYCEKCWNWIHLQKWTDKDGNTHTLRSERIVLIK